jgi:hypothetical protein
MLCALTPIVGANSTSNAMILFRTEMEFGIQIIRAVTGEFQHQGAGI